MSRSCSTCGALAGRRGNWADVLRRAIATGDDEHVRVAADVVADLPPVSALQAPEADRRLVGLLTGRPWIVMQQARESAHEADWPALMPTTHGRSPGHGKRSVLNGS